MWAIIVPPAKRHLNGVSLAGRWWHNIECLLGNFVVLQGIRTSIAKKPYVGGGGSPLDPCMVDNVILNKYNKACALMTWLI